MITSTDRVVYYSCNGVTTSFAFTFPISEESDLKVYIKTPLGVTTLLTLGSNYSISNENNNWDNGGSVDIIDDEGLPYAYPEDFTLTLVREVPLTQPSVYVEGRSFSQVTLMNNLDRLTMILQDINELLYRGLHAPYPEGVMPDLPSASSRAGCLLGFDATGSPVAEAGIPDVTVSSFMKPVVQAFTAVSARGLLEAKGDHDNVKSILDTYTALTTDETLLCSKEAGFTVTLFTAVGNTGKRLNIFNAGASGVITIAGSGAETIGGAATQTLTLQYTNLVIESDGSNWLIVCRSLYNGCILTALIGDLQVTAGKIANATITDAQVAVANKDGAVGTYSMRTLGVGGLQSCAGDDPRLSDARTPLNASVSQAKLKTSTGSVSMVQGTLVNLTLPGGEYGFYPQVKGVLTEVATVKVTAQIASALPVNSYVTNIAVSSDTQYSAVYAQQRYVTSSGEVHWVFILRDKATKKILSMYQAPDHPCFGNGGKPLLVPHPFGDYNPEKHEIIVINPSDEDVFNMQDACIMPEDKPDRDILEVITEDYEIDEDPKTEWPKKEITVGLPKNIDWKRMPEGSKVVPVKKRIPQPDYITTRKLWKRKERGIRD